MLHEYDNGKIIYRIIGGTFNPSPMQHKEMAVSAEGYASADII